tara:strand:+ start:736 stop:888 length:153 start_codon:yes stop_codon:yes gene_type:complete
MNKIIHEINIRVINTGVLYNNLLSKSKKEKKIKGKKYLSFFCTNRFNLKF